MLFQRGRHLIWNALEKLPHFLFSRRKRKRTMEIDKEEFRPVSIIRPARVRLPAMDDATRQATLQRALFLAGIETSTAEALDLSRLLPFPSEAKAALQSRAGERWVHVTGPVDDQTIFLSTQGLTGVVVNFGGGIRRLQSLRGDRVSLQRIPDDDRIGYFELTPAQHLQLTRPRTMLAALYHPENFPLPRFALGIADLARSIREEWLGEVQLLDMQLGETVNSILAAVCRTNPELLGISVTFGQFDVLDALLRGLERLPVRPTVVVGGSLGALLCDDLLQARRVDFVATGAGELTIRELARYMASGTDINLIPDCSYWDAVGGRIVRTGRSRNKDVPSMIPELDLLPATLRASGVMQLESSRGCSYACSFCPREHKGMWSGEHADSLEGVLPYVSAVFNAHPQIDRRIFLVDEEFVGYQEEALAQSRCIGVASQLAVYGFRFETSSRIDQVYRARRDKAWHLERMKFWRQLSKIGLDRCLFGVESGVDSVLQRFNKKTTCEQNVRALRLLSLLDIPIRCTYITFDPLMTLEELGATLRFLARDDLFLRPYGDELEEEDYSRIYDIACDSELAKVYSTGRPFYHTVSYMGVSMEALIGSKYLRMVEEAGLAGEVNRMMGRREAAYRDERIGRLSEVSQYWVDRNFSLDYVLKSLEKCSSRSVRHVIRDARLILKEASFSFIMNSYEAISSGAPDVADEIKLKAHFEALLHRIAGSIDRIAGLLDAEKRQSLQDTYAEWCERDQWRLINGICIAS